MRAALGLIVAAAVLVVGGLPALALVLDDDAPQPGHARSEQAHRHGPPEWAHSGDDREDGHEGRDRPGGPRWGGPRGGELPPRVEKCLRGAPDGPRADERSSTDGSGASEVPPWKDKGLRTFARCLKLLEKRPVPGSES